MTKQELVDYCSKRVTDLQIDQMDLRLDSEDDFYNDFFSEYSVKSLKGLTKIPPADLVIAYLNAVISDKDFDTIYEDVESFSYILNQFDKDDISLLNFTFASFLDSGNFDRLREQFTDSNKIRVCHVLFGGKEGKLMNIILKRLVEIDSSDLADISKLMDYYAEHHKIMFKIIELVSVLKDAADFYENVHIDVRDELNRKVNVKEKVYNKFVEDHAKELYKTKNICSEFAIIEQYHNNLRSNIRSKERKLEKAEKSYVEFINNFPKIFNGGEITNYQTAIKNIPDEDVRLEFLKLVYEHNMEVYEKNMLSYNELAKNSSIGFLTLLQENGISKDEVRISNIMKNSFDDVAKMLKLLKGLFDDKRIIVKALELANLSDILYLKELLDKGVLSKDAITKDVSIFSSESKIRKMLDENIKTLNEFGLNPAILGLNPEMLLNNESLKNNLTILKDYDLIKYLKGQNNYLFLDDNDLVLKIDKLLELGYESFIKEDITLLNEDNIDRIYVLKGIGVIPSNKEELLNYLRTDKFLVSSDKMGDYIHNVVGYVKDDFKLDVNSIISEYDNTNRTICINGVILSKNRIKRNSSLGNFKSIINDSILTKDEVDTLRSELKSKELIKNS